MMKYLFTLILIPILSAWASDYPRATKFEGYYVVPTQHKLTYSANWKLKNVSWIQTDKNVRASYTLPASLVGEETEIMMTGRMSKDGFFSLDGEKVTATCTQSKAQYVCLVKFKNLKVDEKLVSTQIQKSYKKIRVAKRRILVARLFAADPLGVIHIQEVNK